MKQTFNTYCIPRDVWNKMFSFCINNADYVSILSAWIDCNKLMLINKDLKQSMVLYLRSNMKCHCCHKLPVNPVRIRFPNYFHTQSCTASKTLFCCACLRKKLQLRTRKARYLKCPLCDINMMALQNSNNIYLTTTHPPHYIYCGISKLGQLVACLASKN